MVDLTRSPVAQELLRCQEKLNQLHRLRLFTLAAGFVLLAGMSLLNLYLIETKWIQQLTVMLMILTIMLNLFVLRFIYKEYARQERLINRLSGKQEMSLLGPLALCAAQAEMSECAAHAMMPLLDQINGSNCPDLQGQHLRALNTLLLSGALTKHQQFTLINAMVYLGDKETEKAFQEFYQSDYFDREVRDHLYHCLPILEETIKRRADSRILLRSGEDDLQSLLRPASALEAGEKQLLRPNHSSLKD